MTVLSVIICKKGGKILLSRSYDSKMSRSKNEGLVISFSKLLSKNPQRSYAETGDYRFVFQLMDNEMYLLLITNKRSNIIQDLSLLRTLFNLTKEKLITFEVEKVDEMGFDLFFLYDECITGGHPEMLSSDQVNTILKMESHEENLHDIVIQNRIAEAKKKAKKKEREIRKKLQENQGKYTSGIESKKPDKDPLKIDFGANYERFKPSYQEDKPKEDAYVDKSFKKPKGLKLGMFGSQKKESTFLEEMGIEPEPESNENEEHVEQKEKQKERSDKGVFVRLSENISCTIDSKESETSLTVKGLLSMAVNEDACSTAVLFFDDGIKRNKFKYRQHPTTDSSMFEKKGIIQLKKNSKGFKVGGVLKLLQWRNKDKSDESMNPLILSCWPNESSSGWSVAVEFENESEIDLHDLIINIPLPMAGTASIDNCEVGTYKIIDGGRKRVMRWSIPPQYKKGIFEFSIDEGNEKSFFPITAKFHAKSMLAGLKLKGVKNKGGKNCVYDCETVMSVDKFVLTG